MSLILLKISNHENKFFKLRITAISCWHQCRDVNPWIWKVHEGFSGRFSFGDPIGIGPTASLILCAIAEFIAPLILIVGWKTRLFAIISVINMLVAFIISHDGDPFAKKEKAFIYLIAFVFICFSGAGKYSVDKH